MNSLRHSLPSALLLFVAACASPASVPPPPSSLWGDIITLGQAEQTDAPAILVTQDRVVAAWVGADDDGIHHEMRIVPSGMSPVTMLPLPLARPYAQRLAPAHDSSLHLLWLDAAEAGETHLFSALVTPEQTVERGPTPLSDRQTLRYAIAPNGDGSLWAIWSSEPIAEPVLFAQYIDNQGRPRQPLTLVSDADWPAVLHISSSVYLFWIQTTTGSVRRGRLADDSLSDIQPVSQGVTFDSGDRLTGFTAASDHTHAYLFWNITRASGQPESWLSTSPLDALAWSEPQRLGVNWTTKSFRQTGFNSGWAFPARIGNRWLSWTVPVVGQLETLPVAAAQGNNLSMIYFRNGEIVGYQNIAPITGLIGLPALVTDRDLHLYLAWSEPTVAGYADLKLTMTRR